MDLQSMDIVFENSLNRPTINNRCSNCNKIFDEHQLLVSFGMPCVIGDEIISIPVQEAIAYIYGTSCEDFQNYLDNSSDGLDKTTMSMNVVTVCQSCAILLEQIYTSFLKFESETDSMSIVEEVKRSCRNSLNRQMSNGKCSAISAISPPLTIDSDNLAEDFRYEEFAHLVSGDNLSEGFVDCLSIPSLDDTNENDLETPKEGRVSPHETEIVNTGTETKKNSTTKTEINSNTESMNNKSTIHKITNVSAQNAEKSKKVKEMCQGSTNKKKAPKKEEKMNEKGNDKQYRCKICGKGANSWHSLQYYHMPSHTQNTTCYICQKTLSTVPGLKYHLKYTHKQGKNLTEECEICGREILSKNMELHFKTHEPRDEYICDKCGKMYLRKINYDEHLLTHEEDFALHLCRYCGKTFESKKTLQKHESIHITGRIFSCPICSAKFQTNHTLKEHIQTHSTLRPFVCKMCGKDYKRRSQLASHLKLHSEEKEKGEYTAKCDQCGKLLKNSFRLREHVKLIHLNKKVYECSFCGKRLSARGKLASHENLHKSDPYCKV